MALLFRKALCTTELSLLYRHSPKEKDQLDPIHVEGTCEIANVRIQVERMIGLLSRKYSILSGILPIYFLQCDPNGSHEAQIPMIDRIITMCATLTNLSNRIVPLD